MFKVFAWVVAGGIMLFVVSALYSLVAAAASTASDSAVLILWVGGVTMLGGLVAAAVKGYQWWSGKRRLRSQHSGSQQL